MTLDREWRHLLAGCDAAQHEAITSDAHPLLVVAGAGSGKTRVLTRRIARRIADGSASAARILALTFTRKAAGELRTRLRVLGLPEPVTAGTFHAIALGELRRLYADRGEPAPVVLDAKARLIAKLLPDRYALDAGYDTLGADGRRAGRRDVLAAVAGEIEWAKARCLAPGTYLKAAAEAGRAPAVDGPLVAEMFAAYEREKSKRRVLDFDDLLLRVADEIDRDPDFAVSQRWRFRHLFVDEIQDANAAQLRLLDAWLGARDDLFAVGDPRQAIYGWNGSEPGAIGEFADRHPGATVIRLDTNYRSTPQIVTVAAAALDRVDREPVASDRPDGAIPTVSEFATADGEVAAVTAALRLARRPGRRWSDCAVLTRTNAQLVAFEVALSASAIPFRSGGATSFFARPEVRALLDASGDPSSTSAFVTFVDDLERQLRGEIAHRSSSSAALDAAGAPDGAGDLRDGSANLDVLARLAREFSASETRPTLDAFTTWARAALRSDPAPGDGDAVTLSTFHRAKGLEWPVVFVTGLEEGYVPIAQARTADALAEERRLLYVALTRASEELHCSWARERLFGSRRSVREPSRHLAAIEAARGALLRLATPDATKAWAAIAASRVALSRPAPT